MRMFAYALLVTCAATPAVAREPQAPMPKSDPGTWASTDDYPPSALRSGAEGVTGFRLGISADGHPEDCIVTDSSGNGALDEATCKAILAKAQFVPATDAEGKNVESTWSNSVRWEIPKPTPLPPPGSISETFVVETDGSLSDCHIEKAEGSFAAGAVGACDRFGDAIPILDQKGEPVRKRVRITMNVVYEDAPN